MPRYCFLFIVCFGFFCSINAQELNDREWDIAYVGNNLWNPGLQVGRLIYGKGHHDLPVIYQARLGAYWDPRAQFNLFAFAGWQYRRSFTQRNHFDIRISPFGIFRSFYPEAYHVLADGSTDKIFLPGRWYYAPEFSITWGYKLKNEQINHIYFGPQLMFLMPYDGRMLPILNFQVGLNLNNTH